MMRSSLRSLLLPTLCSQHAAWCFSTASSQACPLGVQHLVSLQYHYATESTSTRPPSREEMMQKALRMQEGGFKQAPQPRRGGPPPMPVFHLSGMDNMKAVFYSVINDTDPTVPSSKHQQKCMNAVRGLLMKLQEGLDAAKERTAKLHASARQGSPPIPLLMPQMYRADEDMMNIAFRVIAGYYKLPVGGANNRLEITMRLEAVSALRAAQELSVLVDAVEATPGVRLKSWHLDYLLCAWRFAGKPDMVHTLLQRYVANAQTTLPNVEGARHAFFAFKEANDLQGLWSYMKMIASNTSQLAIPWAELVPRFVHMTVLAVLKARRWDILDELQGMITKLQKIPELQQLDFTYSSRMMVMGVAAQDNQLHIARQALSALAQKSKSLSRVHKQQFPGLEGESQPKSKINQAALLEVLHACVRWPDAAEAKTTALQAFKALEQSLPVSNFHPRVYYQQISGNDSASSQPLPPPLEPSLTTPSVPAYHALIHVLARARDWSAMFDVVDRLEQLVQAGLAPLVSLSAHRGLGSAAEEIANAPEGVKAAAAAAYNVLTLRQTFGQTVSCAMMNIVLRGLALGGEVDTCGRLFEEYKVAGLPHDVAAYNAVIESCCVARKPQAAYGVLEYMASQNVMPGTDTYDLLLRAFVEAEDIDGALEALKRLREGNACARYRTIQSGFKLAKRLGHPLGIQAFLEEFEALAAHEARRMKLQEHQQQDQQQAQGAGQAGGLEAAAAGDEWQEMGGAEGYEGEPSEGQDVSGGVGYVDDGQEFGESGYEDVQRADGEWEDGYVELGGEDEDKRQKARDENESRER